MMQRFNVPNNKRILAQASICVNKKGTNPTDEIPSGIVYIFVEYAHFFRACFLHLKQQNIYELAQLTVSQNSAILNFSSFYKEAPEHGTTENQ